MPVAAEQMVVDHADGVQPGVDDRGADEGEAALLQVAADGIRERRGRGPLLW